MELETFNSLTNSLITSPLRPFNPTIATVSSNNKGVTNLAFFSVYSATRTKNGINILSIVVIPSILSPFILINVLAIALLPCVVVAAIVLVLINSFLFSCLAVVELVSFLINSVLLMPIIWISHSLAQTSPSVNKGWRLNSCNGSGSTERSFISPTPGARQIHFLKPTIVCCSHHHKKIKLTNVWFALVGGCRKIAAINNSNNFWVVVGPFQRTGKVFLCDGWNSPKVLVPSILIGGSTAQNSDYVCFSYPETECLQQINIALCKKIIAIWKSAAKISANLFLL